MRDYYFKYPVSIDTTFFVEYFIYSDYDAGGKLYTMKWYHINLCIKISMRIKTDHSVYLNAIHVDHLIMMVMANAIKSITKCRT